MDANVNPIELCGTVAAVIYQKTRKTATPLLWLDVDDGSQTMVVGCIPYAVPGESMIGPGSWMTHPAHGQQFEPTCRAHHAGDCGRDLCLPCRTRRAHQPSDGVADGVALRCGHAGACSNTSRKSSARSKASVSKAKGHVVNFRRQAGMRPDRDFWPRRTSARSLLCRYASITQG